jgi:hypothetical protein
MPDQARRKAQDLLTLLTEVRQAKPDARDFALFDRRDALAGLGVPHTQIDGFDAKDDAALDRHIADARSVAKALGASQDDDRLLFGETGREVLQGGASADTLLADSGGDALRSPPVTHPIPPGPTWLERANQIADEEKARAKVQARMDGVHPLNNRFDAERHARWTYRMAKDLGPTLATIIGIGHEITGLPALKFNETLMDLHNNGVGIGQARAGGALPNTSTPGLKMQPGRK